MESGRPCTKLSRRRFLKGAGLSVIGAAGLAAITAGEPSLITKTEANGGPTEKWPWPYAKLSPEKTAEIAYNDWYRLYCGAAVINSVFSQLREKVGEPYTSFPIDAFVFLEGGISGWGTVCGSNAGANIVTNLIIGPRIADSADGMLMGSEIMQWYSDALLPIYVPKNPRVKTELPKTTSNSPLCHISVGKWMKAAGKDLMSPERRDRCARVTASVAYHLIELLNDWSNNEYHTTGVIPSKSCGINSQHNCADCHGSNVPSPPPAAKKL